MHIDTHIPIFIFPGISFYYNLQALLLQNELYLDIQNFTKNVILVNLSFALSWTSGTLSKYIDKIFFLNEKNQQIPPQNKNIRILRNICWEVPKKLWK